MWFPILFNSCQLSSSFHPGCLIKLRGCGLHHSVGWLKARMYIVRRAFKLQYLYCWAMLIPPYLYNFLEGLNPFILRLVFVHSDNKMIYLSIIRIFCKAQCLCTAFSLFSLSIQQLSGFLHSIQLFFYFLAFKYCLIFLRFFSYSTLWRHPMNIWSAIYWVVRSQPEILFKGKP